MNKKTIALLIISILCISIFGILLGVRYGTADNKKVLTTDQMSSMPSVEGDYRSINNWATVETTPFEGVRISEILSKAGAGEGAEIKIIASDGYFWPKVNEKLTPEDLGKENPGGLYPIMAFKMDGKTLDPEPEGTGPLRLVMPQYKEDDVNKPSWISNVRLIEVGPLSKAEKKGFDEKKVPVDEVWIYGKIGAVYPYGLWLPLIFAGLGLIFGGAAMFELLRKRKPTVKGQTALLIFLCIALCMILLPSPALKAGELTGAGAFTFSVSDLKAMPATSAHYTFLKSQPPYTYYEADYTGVALTYLLEEKLQLVTGATTVTVKASDGYYKSLDLSQVRATYPGGLKVIIAYAKGGSALTGDEGPLRLIVPQTVQGNKDQGGDMNTPNCVRMVNAVEVSPIPAGESAISAPGGSLAVYGAVTARQAEQPATPAAATTTTEQQAAAQAQAQGTVPGQEAVQSTLPAGQVEPSVYARRMVLCSLSLGLSTTIPRFTYLPLILLR